MSESSVMLKLMHQRKYIASNVFDTIDRITITEPVDVTHVEAEHNPDPANNSSVSVPNKQTPLKFSKTKPLNVCVYQVRTDGLYPFLLFLLCKLETMTFHRVSPFAGSGNAKKLKYIACSSTQKLLPAGTFTYAGFAEMEEENIIILQCAEQRDVYDSSNDIEWATAFEIMNRKKIGDVALHKNVLAFFRRHPSFLTLQTLDQRFYESPMIGYAKAPQNYTGDVNDLDIYRETLLPTLGKCYYLSIDLPEAENVMRIVFFAGKMEVYNVNKRENEEKNKKNDSLLCESLGCFIIDNYNQHLLLSI